MAGTVKANRYVAQAGLIAAVYAVTTVLTLQFLQQFAWGPVQFRLSEAVTVLACFTPAAIPGLWLGAVIANLFMVAQLGPIALWDVVFGSLGSLAGAAWTWRFRRNTAFALAGPVITNALIVPAYLPVLLKGVGFYEVPVLGLSAENHWLSMYAFGLVAVGIGQSVVVYGLGLPLLAALRRLGMEQLLGYHSDKASVAPRGSGGGNPAGW